MFTQLLTYRNAFLFFLVLAFATGNLNAQYFPTDTKAPKPGEEKFFEKLRYGGNLGLWFSQQVTFIELSPRVYYLHNENFLLGAGPTYVYVGFRDGVGGRFNTDVYGGSVIAMHRVFRSLGAIVEVEPVSMDRWQQQSFTGDFLVERVFHTNVYLGGTIWQQSGRSNYFLMLLYNVNFMTRSVYQTSPLVMRIGFGL